MRELVIEILKRNHIEVDQEMLMKIVFRCESSHKILEAALIDAGAGASPELFDIEQEEKEQWEIRWVLKEHAGIL